MIIDTYYDWCATYGCVCVHGFEPWQALHKHTSSLLSALYFRLPFFFLLLPFFAFSIIVFFFFLGIIDRYVNMHIYLLLQSKRWALFFS